MKKYIVNNKNVGVENNGVFRKDVSRAKHLFRVMNAWGISLDVFKKLPGDTRIEIWDKDTETMYTAVRSDLENSGKVYRFTGYEPQMFIPLSQFSKKEKTLDEKAKKKH